MRLLHRSPETPSLETWLGRDVPHERELAGELLNQMGREKSLAALLTLYDKEEIKQIKLRRAVLVVQIALVVTLYALRSDMVAKGQEIGLRLVFFGFLFLIFVTNVFIGFPYARRTSQRQKNTITTLFDYSDNPLIADPLCRAIAYYDKEDRLSVFANLTRVLPLLPNDKDALTKDARRQLIGRLQILDGCYAVEDTSEKTERTVFADFEIAVLRYFARTRDKDALPTIRQLAKGKAFSDDGRRVQDAARAALQAFPNPPRSTSRVHFNDCDRPRPLVQRTAV